MEFGNEMIKWIPQTVMYGLLCFIAINTARVIKFVVNKTYQEIMNMLKQIQDRLSIFEVQINDARAQFKDGINELKLQMSGLVPFSQYHDFTADVKDELALLREKIARLENR